MFFIPFPFLGIVQQQKYAIIKAWGKGSWIFKKATPPKTKLVNYQTLSGCFPRIINIVY
jgi:hypothetical protein